MWCGVYVRVYLSVNEVAFFGVIFCAKSHFLPTAISETMWPLLLSQAIDGKNMRRKHDDVEPFLPSQSMCFLAQSIAQLSTDTLNVTTRSAPKRRKNKEPNTALPDRKVFGVGEHVWWQHPLKSLQSNKLGSVFTKCVVVAKGQGVNPRNYSVRPITTITHADGTQSHEVGGSTFWAHISFMRKLVKPIEQLFPEDEDDDSPPPEPEEDTLPMVKPGDYASQYKNFAKGTMVIAVEPITNKLEIRRVTHVDEDLQLVGVHLLSRDPNEHDLSKTTFLPNWIRQGEQIRCPSRPKLSEPEVWAPRSVDIIEAGFQMSTETGRDMRLPLHLAKKYAKGVRLHDSWHVNEDVELPPVIAFKATSAINLAETTH